MTLHFPSLLQRTVRLAALALLTLGAFSAAGARTLSTGRPVTIAVVRDGRAPLLDASEVAFRREAQALTAGRVTLDFVDAPAYDAQWDARAVVPALEAALANPAVDFVVVIGPRVTAAAADPGRPLSKPVLGALLHEPDLLPLPVDPTGRTTKENFAVVVLTSAITDHLTHLSALAPLRSLHVLLDEFFARDEAAIQAWRDGLAAHVGGPVTLVPIGADAEAALTALGEGAEAVLLLPALRMDEENRAALLSGLTRRRLPVFSYLGRPEVEAGALAGVLPDAQTVLARRLAINLDQHLAGVPAADRMLRLQWPAALFINEDTAEAIGAAPQFATLAHATLIRTGVPAAPGTPLSLSQAMRVAVEQNFTLRAQASATEAARQAERAAAGALLPQVVLSQAYQQIDSERAAASGGAQPETKLRGSLGVSQVVLDEAAFTRRQVAGETRRAANAREEVERLDTAVAAGQAFLQLLSAQTSWRIVVDNLRVTERNLELAQLRQRVGTAGPEEGFRFESLAAEQRADLVAARAQVDQARVALNRVLGVDLGRRWDTQETTLEDEAFAFTTRRVVDLVRDRAALDRFRSFSAAYALAHSPDLQLLDRNVAAQRLTARQKQRHFVPTITASAELGHVWSQQFAVARSAAAPERRDWSVAVSASLPLFAGGARTAEARRARAELRELELTHDGAREAIMAGVQSSLYAAESAYAAIDLSQRAAELAARNLAVVQDKYEQGAVSLVTLLDAQSAAYAQRQTAAAAIYRFLAELLNFQRGLGWLEPLATPAEKSAWFAELERALAP